MAVEPLGEHEDEQELKQELAGTQFADLAALPVDSAGESNRSRNTNHNCGAIDKENEDSIEQAGSEE